MQKLHLSGAWRQLGRVGLDEEREGRRLDAAAFGRGNGHRPVESGCLGRKVQSIARIARPRGRFDRLTRHDERQAAAVRHGQLAGHRFLARQGAPAGRKARVERQRFAEKQTVGFGEKVELMRFGNRLGREQPLDGLRPEAEIRLARSRLKLPAPQRIGQHREDLALPVTLTDEHGQRADLGGRFDEGHGARHWIPSRENRQQRRELGPEFGIGSEGGMRAAFGRQGEGIAAFQSGRLADLAHAHQVGERRGAKAVFSPGFRTAQQNEAAALVHEADQGPGRGIIEFRSG